MGKSFLSYARRFAMPAGYFELSKIIPRASTRPAAVAAIVPSM
jgi:hypothetical protein